MKIPTFCNFCGKETTGDSEKVNYCDVHKEGVCNDEF